MANIKFLLNLTTCLRNKNIDNDDCAGVTWFRFLKGNEIFATARQWQSVLCGEEKKEFGGAALSEWYKYKYRVIKRDCEL